VEIEYISIVDAEMLQSVEKIAGKVLAAVAVRIGPARLIDNILVDTGK
jgi:pantoate--beta-alanine ligase